MKQVEYFSLKLVADVDGQPPVYSEQGETFQMLGDNLTKMGERIINNVAAAEWDVFSLLDAGYSHSLLHLQQEQPVTLKRKMWLIITLTESI